MDIQQFAAKYGLAIKCEKNLGDERTVRIPANNGYLEDFHGNAGRLSGCVLTGGLVERIKVKALLMLCGCRLKKPFPFDDGSAVEFDFDPRDARQALTAIRLADVPCAE